MYGRIAGNKLGRLVRVNSLSRPLFVIYTIKIKIAKNGENCHETSHGISGRLMDGGQLGSNS